MTTKDWLGVLAKTEWVLGIRAEISSDRAIDDLFLSRYSNLHFKLTTPLDNIGTKIDYSLYVEVLETLCFFYKIKQAYNAPCFIPYSSDLESVHFKTLQNYLHVFPQFRSTFKETDLSAPFTKLNCVYRFLLDKNYVHIKNNYDFGDLSLSELIPIQWINPDTNYFKRVC